MLVIFSYLLLACAAMVACIVAANVLLWPVAQQGPLTGEALISVLVPARNEAANVAACLDAISSQVVGVEEILVYDDHSTDDTAAIVQAYARRDARIRLISPSPLPPGWCGKNFACYRLACEAKNPWLLFLDADTRIAPTLAACALWEAKSRGATLLSFWPGLDLHSISEKLLMPMLSFIVFSLYPAPLSFRRRDPSLGLAHGACIFAHRATYFEIGGHERVRGEIFEDTRLARVWREAGHLSLCVDGQFQVRVRMYASFTEIWHGFQKNFYLAFRHPAIFWAFMGLHATVFFAPFGLLVLSLRLSGLLLPNIAAACLLLGSRAILLARFRQPIFATLAHPAAELVLLALGLSSWWRCVSGHGVQWKGRWYRSRKAAPHA